MNTFDIPITSTNNCPIFTLDVRNKVGVYGSGAKEESTARRVGVACLDADQHYRGSRTFGPLSQSAVNSKYAYNLLERNRPISQDLSTLQNAIKSLK